MKPIPLSKAERKHSGGKKYDTGKLRWSLLPIAAVNHVLKVLEFGANKYGADNWHRLEDLRMRYWNAAMRHLTAWRDGEVWDKESGLHHLAHAATCILFVLWKDLKLRRIK